jgi:hypothetical protein
MSVSERAVQAGAAALRRTMWGSDHNKRPQDERAGYVRAVLEVATVEIDCPACKGSRDAGWEGYAIQCRACSGSGKLRVVI